MSEVHVIAFKDQHLAFFGADFFYINFTMQLWQFCDANVHLFFVMILRDTIVWRKYRQLNHTSYLMSVKLGVFFDDAKGDIFRR